MSVQRSADLFAPDEPAPDAPQRPARQAPLETVIPHRPVPAAAGQASLAELWMGVQVTAAAAQAGQEPSAALRRLAARAQRLTPRVALAPPDGLLLEVKGSLHLFGGVDGLKRQMSAACAHCGLRGTLALAPTPLAALTAARAGRPLVMLDSAQLVGQLAALPLEALRWPPKLLGRLACIGVRTIGQALRLPRAGFAQRFGAAQLHDLDRLTGHARDPWRRFEARLRFRRRRELSFELESRAGLLAALAPLLGELERFLQARQCGVLELECRLWHRGHPPSLGTLRLAEPQADAGRLAELLGERLGTLSLPAPVQACELRSGVPVPREPSCGGLWQPGEQGGSPGAGSSQLIERLRARLGCAAVHGLARVPDHRPEAAWRATEPEARPGEDPGARRCAARPLWLLPSPRRLTERDGLPRYRGGLRLASEPERIETGWWDGAEAARDYYIALDTHGRRLWIFRERNRPHRWFLHGVFG